MKKIGITILIIVIITLFVLSRIFNVKSNTIYAVFHNSPNGILITNGVNNVDVNKLTINNIQLYTDTVYQSESFSHCKLHVRRASSSKLERVVSSIITSEINIFEFDSDYFDFKPYFKNNFIPTCSEALLNENNLNFCINLSFYDPKHKPMGLVIKNGKTVNKAFNFWSGYFFVKNGVPYFSAKSLVDEIPGKIEQAIQAYPSIIKNHQIFSYILKEKNKYFDAEKLTYRSLVGMKENGNIVFVLSGNGGVLNIKEIAQIANSLNLVHATMFDGGRTLQYSLELDDYNFEFHAFNNRYDFFTGKLRRSFSSVFLGIKKRNN